MEQSKPIEINQQIIYGRDKVWLNALQQNDNSLTLLLEIEFENRSSQLNLIFSGLLFHSSTELDTYEKSKWSSCWLQSQSNFEIIEQSDLINERVKIRSDYNIQDFKHYRISTYDYIIDVIAKNYQLKEAHK
ncbi:hypothetical protein IT82_12680 [Listeria monocytogenes]|uniref:hypothetical protein n=1 Tax=Listeria monocytogenes TaxID=1639 RepID=UPI0010B9ADD9|nr:hypothetical protein [Listeria monocytogenes]EAC8327104.1 hypothetical protein [Listeria monocytogenes]EAC8329770.1 hypothetical protein [Listeria monocytogenes]EAC8637294.1 hypothetical protein [Listeria monocytogenes]ECB9820571.1 hypothetical protein [Listeria monocytogenes]